ncbi:MAG: hypothetical protein ACRC9O_09450 [Plesiomonas sp.]|uniref:hypothetical protein n=1 Tax=Plesiomonas sp. TaxID=2486279 RepID=UPI003F2F2FA9
MGRIVLTVEQIKNFASSVGLTVTAPEGLIIDTPYIICHGEVPAFESDNGDKYPTYRGLIAYSDALPDGAVIELE